MFFRTIRNDLLRNKAITLTTVIFIAAAAMLVSLAAILVVNLSGAINTLMDRAQTPHFMQMHAGELDPIRLQAFADGNQNVVALQTVEFLNIDGARIIIDEHSLATSVQDNGLTIQSEKFDFLLDLDGNVIQASNGEIYVPIAYLQDGTASLGDPLEIFGEQFTVAGFLRDSQMNSLLASSKRFLVSERDYDQLAPFGSVEYLIEFRLKDPSAIGAFAAAYTSAGLEANGPTITYALFKMMNGLSDGLMIAVILLISAMVVAIAFLCIRFTLLAKIEEDYLSIGVMKAIGLRVSDIKRLYLAKYAAIAALGSTLGFALSFIVRGMLLENIRLYMGESENTSVALLLAILSVLLVFLAIIAYVSGVLKRFRKISPAQAIRFGVSHDQSAGIRRFTLSKIKLLGINAFLGIRDVLSRKKIYATMLVVLVISAFIITVPQNLHSTISSDGFITYMGIGNSDLRFDIQQTANIEQKAAEIVQALDEDPSVSRVGVLTTKAFRLRLEDGTEEQVKIELGDHALFPLTYAQGAAPAAEDEIALSVMKAEDLGKTVGDLITLIIAGQERLLTVSGIYSDVTNGGKTAKAVFTDPSADIMWSVISVELMDRSLTEAKILEYADRFDFAKVSGIDEYVAQTYGSTINAIGKASSAAIGIALTITVLVTLLFIRMLVAKDRYSIAVMKALGYRNSDIKTQYLARAVSILLLGVTLGTLLANTLGEALAGAVISTFGAASFEFVVNPFLAYLLFPLLMACAVLSATTFGTFDVGLIKIAENIKE